MGPYCIELVMGGLHAGAIAALLWGNSAISTIGALQQGLDPLPAEGRRCLARPDVHAKLIASDELNGHASGISWEKDSDGRLPQGVAALAWHDEVIYPGHDLLQRSRGIVVVVDLCHLNGERGG